MSAYQGQGSQGDAGSISLYAPIGGVALGGTVKGNAGIKADGTTGRGGSFSVVTNTLDAVGGVNLFSALNTALRGGGFTETLNIEASGGDIGFAATDSVRARSVTMTADGGSINVSAGGTIDVSQQDQGGSVELYAQNISMAGSINAGGGNAGGEVTLGVGTAGELAFFSGASIDVSGSAQGGTVTFQAPLTGASYNQLNMSLGGTVYGAASVVAEAVRTYAYDTPSLYLSSVVGATHQTVSGDTSLANFITDQNKNNVFANLIVQKKPTTGTQLHLRPGIVIQNTGDIYLDQDWDLTTWRYGSASEAGTSPCGPRGISISTATSSTPRRI